MLSVSNVSRFLLLGVCLAIFSAMDFNKPGTGAPTPDIKFAQLKEGAAQLTATIAVPVTTTETAMTESPQFDVKDFSFGSDGATTLEVKTEVMGVESMTVDFSEVSKIEVDPAPFESNKLQKIFVKATITKNNGAIVNDVLFPQFLQINGRDVKDNIDKTWFLSKVKSISIKHTDITKAVDAANNAYEKSHVKHKVTKHIGGYQ